MVKTIKKKKAANCLRLNENPVSQPHGYWHIWLEKVMFCSMGPGGHSSGSKQARGTGLLSGGRPQRGHTVECSSSRVTYYYTVLSPVKSIYTHAQKARWKHASDIWTNRMKVRKDWERCQESKRLYNAHGCTLKLGYLCFACICHML